MAEDISVISELHALLDRRPFRPFTIVLENGDRYVVNGRNQVAVGRTVVILIGPDSPSIHMNLHSIIALEDPQPAAGNPK